MCLSKCSTFNKKEVLAKLSDPFPVWRIMQKDGHARYDWEHDEGKTLKRTEHTAKLNHSFHRCTLVYEPSFHGYLDKAAAEKNKPQPFQRLTFIVRKYWVKKEDVVFVGTAVCDFKKEFCCIAARKITRK